MKFLFSCRGAGSPPKASITRAFLFRLHGESTLVCFVSVERYAMLLHNMLRSATVSLLFVTPCICRYALSFFAKVRCVPRRCT